MKSIFSIILSIFAILFSFTCTDRQESILNEPKFLAIDTEKTYDVVPYIEYFEDVSGELDFEKIREASFYFPDPPVYNLGFSDSVYWLKVNINDSHTLLSEHWIFSVEQPQLDSVIFYFPLHGGGYYEKKGGDTLPFREREIKSRVLNFTLPIHYDSSLPVYVRIQSTSSIRIPIYLSTIRLFLEKNSETKTVLGIYFGIIGVMAVYNLFIYFVLREKVYLYYVMAVLASLIYIVAFYGVGYKYLWSESVYIQGKIIPLSGVTALFFMSLFTLEFLNTRQYTRKLDKILRALLILLILEFIYILSSAGIAPLILLNYVVVIHCLMYIIIGSIIRFRGNKSARMYIIGWGFASCVGILFVLQLMGILQRINWLDDLIKLSGAIEVILFSFALADRINVLKEAKIIAEEKLIVALEESNKELELRVKKRTKALESSNKHNEALLKNILPEHVIERLKTNDEYLIVDSVENASILFADVVGFTRLSQLMPPEELIALLNNIFSHFDVLTMVHQLDKMKTIGDSYMVVGGLPGSRPDHLEAIANLALDMMNFGKNKQLTEILMKYPNFQIRVGIHIGNAVAGVIGIEKISYDIWGDSVNTASRMESHSVPNKIHTSREVYDRLKDKFVFEERGEIDIKGKGKMNTYFLTGKRHS